MLSIADIVRETGIDRSCLQRYLNEADVREALGGTATHPNYPDEALPLFRQLADLHQRGEVKPKTLAVRLKSKTDNRKPIIENRSPETGQNLVVMPQQAVQFLDQIADAVGHRVAAHLLPPAEDRLISAQEASELLHCKPERVREFVPAVKGRRGVWKRSAILRYIQSL